MATRFDDFSGYSTGAFSTVASAHWTAVAETGTSWTRNIVAAASQAGGNALVFGNGGQGNSEQLYYSPTPGSTTSDLEVLAYLKWGAGKNTSSSAMSGAVLMAATGACYSIRLTAANTWQLARFGTAGTLSASLGTATDLGIPGTADLYHWIRLGRVGTNSLRAKIWTGTYGDQPTDWQLTATDTALTTLYGGIGVHSYEEQPTTIDILSIGIGENAPSGSAGGSGGIPKTTKLTLLGVG